MVSLLVTAEFSGPERPGSAKRGYGGRCGGNWRPSESIFLRTIFGTSRCEALIPVSRVQGELPFGGIQGPAESGKKAAGSIPVRGISEIGSFAGELTGPACPRPFSRRGRPRHRSRRRMGC